MGSKNSYVLPMEGYNNPQLLWMKTGDFRHGLCIHFVISNIREVNTKLRKSKFTTHVLA